MDLPTSAPTVENIVHYLFDVRFFIIITWEGVSLLESLLSSLPKRAENLQPLNLLSDHLKFLKFSKSFYCKSKVFH